MWKITPPANQYTLQATIPEDAHRLRHQIMPIHPIIRYPDPRLSLPAQPVTVFDGARRELANDLLETMHAAPGIGITGPHTDRRAILDKAIADHKATQS